MIAVAHATPKFIIFLEVHYHNSVVHEISCQRRSADDTPRLELVRRSMRAATHRIGAPSTAEFKSKHLYLTFNRASIAALFRNEKTRTSHRGFIDFFCASCYEMCLRVQ